MNRSIRWLLVTTALVAASGVGIALFRPAPIPVDLARVVRGPLQVTVDEEGETRARDRYVVAAPVAGRVARIGVREGDRVSTGAVVARISPTPLDARAREQAQSRVESAGDAQRAADAAVAQARAAFAQAHRSAERTRELAARRLVSPEQVERAELDETTRRQELEAADFRAQSAAHDVEVARAVLLAGSGEALALRAPVSGRVLRVFEPSERVVPAGVPLLELGDAAALEIVVDLLSSDAVRVAPGAVMLLDGWGGDATLRGRVRVVEPSGFTKVSALGVEEQRVNVIGDFVDAPGRLGDRYRLDVRIVVWEGADVLTVPASALFRTGEGWSLFVVDGGRAQERAVETGHRTPFAVEILRGVRPGDVVVRAPSDRVASGVRVTGR